MPPSLDPASPLPPRASIYGALRREVAQTLAPELQSDRAKTIATLIDETLRFLLLQEKTGAEMPAADPGAELQMHRGHAAFDGAIGHMAFDDDRLVVSAEKVATYLQARWPERRDLRVTALDRVLGGFSKDTYLFEARWSGGGDGFALQRDNPWGSVDSNTPDVHACLVEMYRLGIPVPEPVLVEPRTEPFGHAFLITRKARGRTVPNITSLAVGREQVDAAIGLAQVLGRLHAIAPAQLDPAVFPNRDNPVSVELGLLLDRLEIDWERHRVAPSPTVTAALAWLRDNLPVVSGPLRVVHGDAGMHNLLMDGPRAVAMLDWEFVHLGDPMEDLIYARTWIDQVMPWADFVAHYRAAGGPEVRDGVEDFYTMFYAVRHVMSTDMGLAGFSRSPQPELNSLVASIRYGRHFLITIGEILARHGAIAGPGDLHRAG